MQKKHILWKNNIRTGRLSPGARLLALFLAASLTFSLVGCGRKDNALGNVQLIPASDKEETVLFDEFLDTAFQDLVTEDALSLHFTLRDPQAYGIARQEAAFPDLSAEGIRQTYLDYESLLSRLKSFSRSRLSARQQLVYDTMLFYLTCQTSFSDFPYYEELLSPSSGIHVNLPILLTEFVFSDKEDVEDYLSLLESTDIYFSNVYAYEKEKSDQGLAMNDTAVDQVIAFCRSFGTESEDHLLLVSFRDKIMAADFLTDLEKEEFIHANATAVTEKVLPSYLALGEKMEGLKGSCVNEQGLSHSPRGREYYSLLVKQATGRSDAPFFLFYEISQQRDLDMETMASYFSTDPTLASKCTNYQYEETDPELMLARLQQAIREDFPACEGATAAISTVDDALAPYTAPAFYLIAPIDDYLENVICYNPSKVSSSLDLFTTIAHEGFPGHLYQTVMSYSCGLEPVRSMLSFPGFTEGWATYVEMMSYQYAGLDASLATVLQLNYAVILSLYATADIGIHYFGWDAAKTASFLAEYGITDSEVIDEIYQMILWDPANYLKYYVGYLSFLSLQQDMMARYPDTFSLYEFHKCILETGPTSFEILEKELSDHFSDLTASVSASLAYTSPVYASPASARYPSASSNAWYISRLETPRSFAAAFMASLRLMPLAS